MLFASHPGFSAPWMTSLPEVALAAPGHQPVVPPAGLGDLLQTNRRYVDCQALSWKGGVPPANPHDCLQGGWVGFP